MRQATTQTRPAPLSGWLSEHEVRALIPRAIRARDLAGALVEGTVPRMCVSSARQ